MYIKPHHLVLAIRASRNYRHTSIFMAYDMSLKLRVYTCAGEIEFSTETRDDGKSGIKLSIEAYAHRLKCANC